MRLRHQIAALCTTFAVVLTCGCASLHPEQFGNAIPPFDPVAYFTGATHSWGVIENRSGEPKSRFVTSMSGRPIHDGVNVMQDFTFEDGHRQQRVWTLKRIDAHRYDATAPDVIGVATGYAWGNAFRWEYTLQLKADNPLTRVHMKHWMYLTDGGDVLINRVIISKLGVIVAETTEYFRRGAVATPTVGEPR